jgi:hypothetical protein
LAGFSEPLLCSGAVAPLPASLVAVLSIEGGVKIKRFISREEIMTEPSYDELKNRLAELEKQVDSKKRTGAIDFRVSEKGGVSVYGLGRFPVTLYYEQWTRLLDAVPDLKAFIEENKSKLKLKQG